MPTPREFILSLKEGDVIRIDGTLRVVRYVRHYQNKYYPPNARFGFAIKRCSWTGRGYTFYAAHDLMRRNVELVARNFKSKLEISNKLDKEIKENRVAKGITCCDVVGIIY